MQTKKRKPPKESKRVSLNKRDQIYPEAFEKFYKTGKQKGLGMPYKTFQGYKTALKQCLVEGKNATLSKERIEEISIRHRVDKKQIEELLPGAIKHRKAFFRKKRET